MTLFTTQTRSLNPFVYSSDRGDGPPMATSILGCLSSSLSPEPHLTHREGGKTGTGRCYLKQKEGFHTWASIPAFRVEKEGLGACLARGDHALEGDTGEMSLL